MKDELIQSEQDDVPTSCGYLSFFKRTTILIFLEVQLSPKKRSARLRSS